MDKILRRLDLEYDGTGLVLSLNKMWGCFAADGVVGYAFEPDRQYNFVENDGFQSLLAECIEGMVEPIHWLLSMPAVAKALLGMPDWIQKALDEKMAPVLEFKQVRSNCGHASQHC